MIILLGGSGYVGSAFRQELTERGTPFRVLRRAELDYTQPLVLKKALQQFSSSFVINCAGYTGKPNVDACERQKLDCLQANAVLPGQIARVCSELDIPWGHVSSGCIFTGCRRDGGGFTEEDLPNFSFRQNNCSFYSGCKALGEELLSDAACCYIWRLRIPFSEADGSRNYLSKLQRYDRLLDATNSLSHLGEFVACCLHCIEHQVPFGTYNLTNPGSVTTRQVVEIIHRYRPRDQPYQFFSDESEFMNEAAIAPRSNCLLDSSKAIKAGLPLSPVEQAIERSLSNWKLKPVPDSQS